MRFDRRLLRALLGGGDATPRSDVDESTPRFCCTSFIPTEVTTLHGPAVRHFNGGVTECLTLEARGSDWAIARGARTGMSYALTCEQHDLTIIIAEASSAPCPIETRVNGRCEGSRRWM